MATAIQFHTRDSMKVPELSGAIPVFGTFLPICQNWFGSNRKKTFPEIFVPDFFRFWLAWSENFIGCQSVAENQGTKEIGKSALDQKLGLELGLYNCSRPLKLPGPKDSKLRWSLDSEENQIKALSD